MVRQPGAIEGECALHFDLANERTPPARTHIVKGGKKVTSDLGLKEEMRCKLIVVQDAAHALRSMRKYVYERRLVPTRKA